MNELTKAFNDLNENQSKLENDFLLKTKEIKKSKIDLLRKILLNGEIKLTKKDFSDYLTFSMNASSYVFSGISNNLLDKNKFNVFAIPFSKFASSGNLDNLLSESFKYKFEINDDKLILLFIDYLVKNDLLSEYKEFNVNITTTCHILARNLDEAIDSSFRTTTYDEKGNDITVNVILAEELKF